MLFTAPPADSRRYPSALYPRVPELHMIGDGHEATNLAKLVVGIAVDNRAIYAVHVAAETYPMGLIHAYQLRRSATNGMEADVCFNDRQSKWLGVNVTEIYYVQTPAGDIGLHTVGFDSAHDHDETGGHEYVRKMYWSPDESGSYQPRASLDPEDGSGSLAIRDIARMAAHYATLQQRIVSPVEFDVPLVMHHANIRTIDPRSGISVTQT